MAYLEIHKGRTVVHTPLEGEANSIGRQDGNSIVINDKDVSRQHCVIEKWDGAYSIYDVGSRNGVVVNGLRVQRAMLKSGDVITLGGTIAKFLDAPLKPVAKVGRKHAWLAWIPAGIALLVTAAVIAWALGLVEDGAMLNELRDRLGIKPDAVRAEKSRTAAPSVPHDLAMVTTKPGTSLPATPSTDEQPIVTPSNESLGNSNARGIEPAERSIRYRVIDRTASATNLNAMLGELVAARFIGKPTHDDRGRVTWELPPDGAVVAVIELQSDAAAQSLAAIEAEPALIEAELAGRLTRDEKGGGFILRVGVIEVLRALSGNDEALAESTRKMIGKRIITNPRYAAANES